MRITFPRGFPAAILAATLIVPTVAPIAFAADDRSYHDKQHNDDHQWNSHEDRAYKIYVKQNHRKYSDFSKLREEDQQSYWGWRHEHSDALLKINIR